MLSRCAYTSPSSFSCPELPTAVSWLSDELDLISVLRWRIALLLRDKEETVMLSGATRWLNNEAASFQNIDQAGLFRKAVWQYLKSRVTPMLAGILTYADINKNLDLLGYAVDNKIKWMQDLWLDLLERAQIPPVSSIVTCSLHCVKLN